MGLGRDAGTCLTQSNRRAKPDPYFLNQDAMSYDLDGAACVIRDGSRLGDERGHWALAGLCVAPLRARYAVRRAHHIVICWVTYFET